MAPFSGQSDGGESRLLEQAQRLLWDLDGREVLDIRRVPGGGNNRVFRLLCDSGPLLLKWYYRHPSDPRDRLGVEFGFLRFAWDRGLRHIPEPVAADRAAGLALHAWIEGRRLRSDELERGHLEQALDFIAQLNLHRGATDSQRLPPASEACFTPGEHLALVDQRVQKVCRIASKDPVHEEARAFAERRVAPAWAEIRAEAERALGLLGQGLDEPLPPAHRCLSPSDFGFHNALRVADGRLYFHDFEYAGWDDPAKLLCDFFCQPRVPVPLEGFAPAVEVVRDRLVLDDRFAARASALFPVFRVKWACICLNEFLPASAGRRRFAREALGEDHLRQQIDLSDRILRGPLRAA